MIIDHSLGLVFLHVPKCAGTALRNAWQDAADGRDVVTSSISALIRCCSGRWIWPISR